MNFERDVFISYAHIDDRPLPPDTEGWVATLKLALEQFLTEYKGAEARVWRDDKLQGNDVFPSEIVSQLAKTAVMVSVLTPRYLKSDWCTRELREFCASAQLSGGFLIGNKARVFKVLKTPVDEQDVLPHGVRDALGYVFFELDGTTPIVLDPSFLGKPRQEFLRMAHKLAWEIKQLLDVLASADGSKDGDAVGAEKLSRPLIYLAQCSRDLRSQREMLESELMDHGFRVLPDRQLPVDESEYLAEVDRLLAKCELSVHLVGSGYGLVPEGSGTRSVVVLQNDVAAQHSNDRDLKRIIWVPRELRATDTQQQAFLHALQNDGRAQRGADLVTESFERFKGIVHAALRTLERPDSASSAAAAAAASAQVHVHIICDEQDRRATVPLFKFFRDHGLGASLPVFAGDASQVRKANEDLIKRADAIVLFYGVGDEAWKHHRLNEMPKLRAGLVRKPLRALCVYLAAPMTDAKQILLDVEEPGLLDGMVGLPEGPLETFVQALTVEGLRP